MKATLGGFVSPGAAITGILGIFEFFLENSCKEQGNYFNITASEPSGGTAAETIDAANETWFTYAGTGASPYGLQMNPSLISYEGTNLHLVPMAADRRARRQRLHRLRGQQRGRARLAELRPLPAGRELQGEAADHPGRRELGRRNRLRQEQPEVPVPGRRLARQAEGPADLRRAQLRRPLALQLLERDQLPGDRRRRRQRSRRARPRRRLALGRDLHACWRCPPAEANDCTTFDEAGSHNGINTVLYSGGSVYAGISNGILWRCSPVVANGCENLANAEGASINALATQRRSDLRRPAPTGSSGAARPRSPTPASR